MTKLQKNDKMFVQSLIFAIVLYSWIALFATLFSVFYAIPIFVLWFFVFALFVYFKIIKLSKPGKDFTLLISIIFIFTISVAYFSEPTIFSGRDQGSIAQASAQLAQNHSAVQHSPEITAFFDIYKKGKALNFPGFFYTADGGLITQFPLPYIAFLSGFFGLFGINGFIVANSILLFTFLVSIVSIARLYLNRNYTLFFLFLLLSSFSFGWFAKFTLSENLANTLLFGALFLYLTLRQSSNIRSFQYFLFFATISLLLFTRIEGWWFFIAFIILALKDKNIFSFVKKDLWWRGVFVLTLLFVTACAVFIVNMPFFITMAKALLHSTSDISNSSSFTDKILYLFSIYAMYGLLLPLVISIFALPPAIKNPRFSSLKVFLFLIAPLTVYYLFPNISSDHPWMLRRFVFALLPITLLISTIFISKTKLPEFAKYAILSIILLANLPAFLLFFTYTPNTTLLTQLDTVTRNFTSKDLVLVDKDTTGSGWTMITGPLDTIYNVPAVYFFNKNDFDKIDKTKFDRVLLITPNSNASNYSTIIPSNSQLLASYSFTTTQLQISRSKEFPPHFPKKQEITTEGKIYKLK